MRKIALIENLIIFVLLALIGLVIYFKYLRNKGYEIQIKTPSQIHLQSFKGATVNFDEIISKKEEAYVFILRIDSCPGSILKSFEKSSSLKAKGYRVVFITVHNWFNEWKAWIENFDFPQDNLYMMKKEEFTAHFLVPHLPIILRFKNGKVVGYEIVH